MLKQFITWFISHITIKIHSKIHESSQKILKEKISVANVTFFLSLDTATLFTRYITLRLSNNAALRSTMDTKY